MATPSLSPSPVPEDEDDGPRVLTPTSKIKAMMAAVDNDSDEAADTRLLTSGRKRKVLATVSGNSRSIKSAYTGALAANAVERESDSEEDAIVPRGRLAARLEAQKSEREKEDTEGNSSGSERAYTRIKERLLNRTGKNREQASGDGELFEDASIVPGLSTASSVLQSPAPENDDSKTMERSTKISSRSDRSQESSPTTQSVPTSPLLPAINSIQDDADADFAQNLSKGDCSLESHADYREEGGTINAKEDVKEAEKITKGQDSERILSQDASGSDDRSDDDLAEKHLTQSARPTRKASKKALEEMNRETQRMNRNMQLAHQARTKRKITKDSLFARFNFRTSVAIAETVSEQTSSSTIPSSAPQSDCENTRATNSPPTSPAKPIDAPLGKSILSSTASESKGPNPTFVNHALTLDEEDQPETTDLFTESQSQDKGKARATELKTSASLVKKTKRLDSKQRPVRVRLPNISSKVNSIELDSDSDFESAPKPSINARKSISSKLDVFHRLPASKLQEGRSLLTLRALAHLNSPDGQVRGKKPSMNIADMQMSLQKRARLQALEERKAKVDDLKARGILVQSVEEREKDQTEVEDLLEKARKEAQEIHLKEKNAARKAKVANGDQESLDSSDDEEYADDQEDNDADGESTVSVDEESVLTGADKAENYDSNSEPEEDEEDLELDEEEQKQNEFLDAQAEEVSGEDDEEHSDKESDDEPRKLHLPRARRNIITIEDEEDDDGVTQHINETPAKEASEDETRLPTIDIPRFPPALAEARSNDLSLGMTQAFAATLAETQGEPAENDEEQDSMDFFLPPPEPDLPLFIADDSQPFVLDTQNGSVNVESMGASHRIDLNFSQTQLQHDILGPIELQKEASDLNEIPDPTQDAGFALSSPAPERFVSVLPSTVDTAMIPVAEEQESPVSKPRGRLVRGRLIQDPVEQEDIVNDEANPLPRDAFKAMQERCKKKPDEAAFDKKKSEAKGMVEEQAMESEDEYAGLGGASDDESGGEEDQDVKAMMDNGDVDVDEGQLAALNANMERASDEKAVEKLFKDINNGGLRRKRGADFELSDSDDDGEARRRRKQREFAKMRKALLADEKVGQIAEDPKKLAFLRAIEDREDDEDLDFLERTVDDSFPVTMDTQEDGVADSQSQQPGVQATPEDGTNKRKRTTLEETNANMRAPPATRRTAAGPSTKRPATLAEIRDSVSFLVESPGAMAMNTPDLYSSASEAEAEAEDENTTKHHHPRRTAPFSAAKNPIVDRLTLKRASTNSSSSSSTSASTSSGGSRLAFYNPGSNTTADGFKIPSLLRRATTSNLSESGNSNTSSADKNGISTYTHHAANERAAGSSSSRGGEEAVGARRRGDKKKSSVNYYSRESAKRGVIEGVERRRREERERMARERRERGKGLGVLGGGGFD